VEAGGDGMMQATGCGERELSRSVEAVVKGGGVTSRSRHCGLSPLPQRCEMMHARLIRLFVHSQARCTLSG